MTLRDLLDRAAEANPARPYLFFRDEGTSLGAVVQRVDALAAALFSLGVRRDDHVAVLLPNRPEFLYCWFALATLGAVLVPVNPVLTPRELRQLLEHADATGLIADGSCLEVAAEAPAGTAVRWVAAVDGAPAGAYDFADLLAGPAGRPPLGPRGDEAIAALVYTSGTTGAPRGVLKTHRAYTRVAQEATSWLGASPDDRFFTALPLFHTNAQVYAVLPSLACGGSLVLAERFSASRFWDAVAACGATVFNHLGTMLAILARTPPTPAERWHRVRVAIGGGATAAVERVMYERFGVRLIEFRAALPRTATQKVRRELLRRPERAGLDAPRDAPCPDEEAHG